MSILQNILTELLDRLDNITIANGYTFDVAKVEQASRDKNKWSPVERGIMVEQMTKERIEDFDCPGNPAGIGWAVLFDVYGFAKQLDVQGTDFAIKDTEVTDNVMMAAIEKSIANSSASDWHQFGTDATSGSPNAIESDFVTSDPWDFVGFDGARVQIVVRFRVSEIDPAVPR